VIVHPDRKEVKEMSTFPPKLHYQTFSKKPQASVHLSEQPNDLSQCRAEPDLEFEGLLKRRHTQIKYLHGSLMNPADLERSKVLSC
jgi:hypothetical protein